MASRSLLQSTCNKFEAILRDMQGSGDSSAETDPVADIVERIRAAGGRATLPRRAILTALVDHRAVHPTAEHITASVRRTHPDVADSTVYRFLDDLEDLGIVRSVRLGDGPAVYHFTDDAEHHHLACDACGRVVQMPAGVLEPAWQAIRDEHGFDVDPNHLTLVGRCAECVESGAPRLDAVRFTDHTHDRDDTRSA